jgi:hypothetical protein
VLHEQDGFDRRFPMSIQKLIDEFLIELARNNFGSAALPPIGFVRPMIKADPAELARVGKNERTSALKQNKMVVFAGSIIHGLDPDLPRHAELNAEPAPNVFASPDRFGVVPGKFESIRLPRACEPRSVAPINLC